jgi:hypothetical protein
LETVLSERGGKDMTAINWKNPVNGDWSVATNWSTNAVPTLVDAAINRLGVRSTISSFDLMSSVNFNVAQTALLENAGSLTMGGRAHRRFQLSVAQ